MIEGGEDGAEGGEEGGDDVGHFSFLALGGEVEVTVYVCVVGERRDLEIWVVL